MDDCAVCTALSDPAASADVLVSQDSLTVMAQTPPSNADAVDGYPGHLLLVPRRHVESPGALTDAEAERIGLWLARATRLLESVLGAEHVYQARLGHGWRHVHYHIVARYPGTPAHYHGLNVRDWAGVERRNRAQLAQVAARLRAAL